MAPYISASGAEAVKGYQYRGGDLSQIYKHFSSPLAAFCVSLLPKWVACVRRPVPRRAKRHCSPYRPPAARLQAQRGTRPPPGPPPAARPRRSPAAR